MNAAVLGFAAGLVLSSVAAGVAEGVDHYHQAPGAPLPLAVTVPGLLALWTGLVGAVVWWSRTQGTGRWRDDYGLRIAAWWDVPAGAALGLACQYGLVPLLYLPFEHLDRHLAHDLSGPTQRSVGAVHSPVALAALLLFLAVGAPLVEELFFRGLLLRSLTAAAGPAAGIVGSGVLFGLAHFEKLQFPGLAVFGVVLAMVAWRLGRLGPTIAAHMSFNAAAVLASVHLH